MHYTAKFQKTPPPGVRPEPLAEVAVPQGFLARCSSAARLWSAVVVHAGLGGHDGRRS